MLKTSFFISFLSAFYKTFLKSGIYSFTEKAVEAVSVALRGTFAVRSLSAAGNELKREGSIFYKIINKISGFVFSLAEKIYILSEGGFLRKCAGLFKSSILFKGENLLAIGLFVIFVCPHEIWNNAYALLFAILVLGVYAVGVAKKKDFGTNGSKIWLPFILFVFAVLFSVVISANVSDSIRVLMFFITSFILCMAIYGMLSGKERFDKICMFIYFALIITGVVAIVQKIMGIEVDRLLTDVELNENMPGRAFSTWANPNNFAQFIIIFFPFCFAFGVTRDGGKKTAALLALLIPFAALLLTYSRSGWLGFAVTVVTFVILYNKKMLPAIILLCILMIPLLPSSVLDRIMTIGNLEDTSSSYRIDIWTGTIAMLKTIWYVGTGLGPGAFAAIYPSFAVETSSEAPHTHMLFLEVFAEMGIIGLVCFAALIVCLVVCTCKASYKVQDGKMKLYTIAAASSMMGILTIGFAEYVWFYPRVMFAFFVAIGMAMATVRLINYEKNN